MSNCNEVQIFRIKVGESANPSIKISAAKLFMKY